MLSKALPDIYPNHDWQLWRFPIVHRGFWDDKFNQKKYMKYLGEKLGFTKMEDFFQIKNDHFHEFDGVRLLDIYGGSPSAVVTGVFAGERDWIPWNFRRLPNMWHVPENRRAYLTSLF